MSAVLRSGELAARAGVNIQTLRYYERRGLLTEPERTPGGHRLYAEGAVRVLRVIKTAQRLGFTLDEVADLLGTTSVHRRRTSAGLHLQAAAKLAEVEERIAELTAMGGMLRAALAAGCDDLIECSESPDCPLPFPTCGFV